MSQALQASERRSIIVDYRLSAAPAKVWRALTEPELLADWLMPNDIKPLVGHDFTFRTDPAPGFDGGSAAVLALGLGLTLAASAG